MPDAEIRLVVSSDEELTKDMIAMMSRDAATALLSEWGDSSYESNYMRRPLTQIRFLGRTMGATSYPSERSFPVTQDEEDRIASEEYDDDDDF